MEFFGEIYFFFCFYYFYKFVYYDVYVFLKKIECLYFFFYLINKNYSFIFLKLIKFDIDIVEYFGLFFMY